MDVDGVVEGERGERGSEMETERESERGGWTGHGCGGNEDRREQGRERAMGVYGERWGEGSRGGGGMWQDMWVTAVARLRILCRKQVGALW